MRPQQNGNAARDIFGADFSGTPSHQRVLKPPGGGSSDIFGTGGEQSVRKVKNHQVSSVFLNDNVEQKVPSTPTLATPLKTPGKDKDSHVRLFGPPSPPKLSPRRGSPKASVASVIAHDQQNGNRPNGQNGHTSPSRESQNGDVSDAPIKEEHQNGNKAPQMNGNGNHVNGGLAPRGRVPPGGFSSGLW